MKQGKMTNKEHETHLKNRVIEMLVKEPGRKNHCEIFGVV
jgi:hypothetical protein